MFNNWTRPEIKARYSCYTSFGQFTAAYYTLRDILLTA